MKRSLLILFVLLLGGICLAGEKKAQPGEKDAAAWLDLIQRPHEDLPTPDIGLRPLLRTDDGKVITSKEAWAEQQRALRPAWIRRLGEPPARPEALDVQVESREVQPDHVRQRVRFTSEDGDQVRAYLLLPGNLKEGEKRPAVIVFHPTTRETLREPVGLGTRPEMALALHLVRRGYVTLSPECYLMKDGGPRSQADKLSRRRPGWTGLGKMVFDASRCVDYLETLAAVDRSRIGCIGHSLGAKEVLYAMAFEPRLKAGVFNEGGIGLRMSNWTDPWYLTAAMKEHIPALENHQVMALIAPRPLLVMGGGDADGKASWVFVKEARRVYALLGATERIGLYDHQGGHSFPEKARRLAYDWLDHWLGLSRLEKP